MGSIIPRTLKNGKRTYRAQIVIREKGQTLHQESRTFDKKSQAKAWMERREAELRAPGGLSRKTVERPTVADAVRKYLETTTEPGGHTKRQVLKFVKDGRCEFSDMHLDEIESHDVLQFARELAAGGRGPATVSSYITHVCHVLSVSEDDHGPDYRVSLDALERGKRSARRNGYAGKPNVRTRRPTLEELDQILDFFERRETGDRRAIPMSLIVPFAIFAVRRQGEIVKLRWEDIDTSEIMVRGAKHPRKPEGVDILTELTKEALRVISLHGERDPVRVFPYNSDTVSRLFTEAVRVCEIEDLHFHDLRHEGVSWLLEAGWTQRHAMRVSGHSSTQTLDRYTNMKQRGDKYENWSGWERLERMHGKQLTPDSAA